MYDFYDEQERYDMECDAREYEVDAEYSRGYADAVEECIQIVKFYEKQNDGIYWAIREIEELKERYGND